MISLGFTLTTCDLQKDYGVEIHKPFVWCDLESEVPSMVKIEGLM